MNARFEVGDLGLAVERPQRGIQQFGAEARHSDRSDRRPLGLVPGDAETVVRHRPRHLQQPARGRERAVFSGIGGELVKNQRKAHRQFGGQKQRFAIEAKADMSVRTEFGEQQILDVAACPVHPGNQVVGRRQRPDPQIDAGPDLRLIVQNLMQHRVDRRQLVFQPVLQLFDHELAILFLLDQAFCDLALLRNDGTIVFDAPDRDAAHRPENQQQRQPREIGRGIAEIDGDAERAGGQRGHNSDSKAAERGGKEHGRKIRGEEYVRADHGKAPPRRGRQGEAEGRKSDAEKRRGLRDALPGQPELVDQFRHAFTSADRLIYYKAEHSGKHLP